MTDAEDAQRRKHLALAAALMLAVIFDVWLVTVMPNWAPGTDLHAAWKVNLADPWAGAATSMLSADVFRHLPVLAQIASLFGGVRWLLARLGFLAVQLALIVLIAGKRWPYVVLSPGVLWDPYFGDVDLLMGAAIVAGFRYPGTWAFLFLTKVTPGIGVLWFVFRGEWRKLGIALGTTAVIVAASFALAPGLWFKWVDSLREMSSLPSRPPIRRSRSGS